MATTLMVWIDQVCCTVTAFCSEICPDVFVARDDGLWVVEEEAEHFGSTIVFDGGEGPGHGPDNGKDISSDPDSLIDLGRSRRGVPRRVHHDRALRCRRRSTAAAPNRRAAPGRFSSPSGRDPNHG